jgi:hypothetical protein
VTVLLAARKTETLAPAEALDASYIVPDGTTADEYTTWLDLRYQDDDIGGRHGLWTLSFTID